MKDKDLKMVQIWELNFSENFRANSFQKLCKLNAKLIKAAPRD